ncbi:hypothetical protein DPMN_096466 [Dreissena polymorpha]|uniref:Uncharacterized protein n=1 Tax=Dreissena polymorpha TaxID=45954 RepID=A0A9D4L8S3_DREPO|nr:hypothetical protein DPMN_096466 [Dreissena polymorpha]
MLLQLCWLCPAALHSKKELKLHLGTEHNRLDLVCPWCVEDPPTTMSRPYDLKRHDGRWHKAIADGIKPETFTEVGAFYVALYPKDFITIVKPSEYSCQASKEAREAIKVWRQSSQAPKLKPIEDWEAGWKLADGVSVVAGKTSLTIQGSGSPTPGVEAYSPSKPAMLPTGGRLPVPFPKMEGPLYNATPIEEPALPFQSARTEEPVIPSQSATIKPDVGTVLPVTPVLEEQNRTMQDWPPKDWRLMSPAKKLAVAQHMANMLDSVEGIPVTEPDQIMDK